MRLMCRTYQDWQEPGCSVDLALGSWSASFRKTSGRVGGDSPAHKAAMTSSYVMERAAWSTHGVPVWDVITKDLLCYQKTWGWAGKGGCTCYRLRSNTIKYERRWEVVVCSIITVQPSMVQHTIRSVWWQREETMLLVWETVLWPRNVCRSCLISLSRVPIEQRQLIDG